MSNPFKLSVNVRFGKLTVIADTGKRTKNRGVIVTCICDCGTIKDIAFDALRRGTTVSCGCVGRENRRLSLVNGTRKLSPNQKQTIVEEYNNGSLANELGDKYGVHSSSIIAIVHARGGKAHGRSYATRKLSGHTVNENAFDELNEETAYWIGFLMADGAIVGNTVALTLAERDKAHVHKFRDFLGGTQKIIQVFRDKEIYSIRYAVQSDKLVSALAEYGVTERKSFTAEPSPILTLNRHFWRGLVDGDGCISAKGYTRLELCGSYQSMNLFSDFVRTQVIDHKSNVKPMKSIWRIAFSGWFAVNIIRFLYEDSSVSLDRKHAIAVML